MKNDEQVRFGLVILVIFVIFLIGMITLVNPAIGVCVAVTIIFGIIVMKVTPMLIEGYRSSDNENRGIAVIVTGLLIMIFLAIFTREREL